LLHWCTIFNNDIKSLGEEKKLVRLELEEPSPAIARMLRDLMQQPTRIPLPQGPLGIGAEQNAGLLRLAQYIVCSSHQIYINVTAQ